MRSARVLALLLPLAALTGIAASTSLAPEAAASSCPAASAPSGAGTSADPYQIGTAAELEWFKATGSKSDDGRITGYYVLTADIDMSGCTWDRGIGGPTSQGGGVGETFTGVFDGANFDILGLTIINTNTWRPTGFFWQLRGTVRNLGLVNLNVSSNANMTGGIAAHNRGLIRDSYVSGSISGEDRTGGLVGYTRSNAHRIIDSWFAGTVTGRDEVGGIVGRLGAVDDGVDISGVLVDGSISGRNQVGGIVGEAGFPADGTSSNEGKGDARITRAINFADVSGTTNIGGIAGSMQGDDFPFKAFITNAANYGAISGNSQVGGISGLSNDLTVLERLIQSGSVSGTGSHIGGILGRLDRQQPFLYALKLQDTLTLGALSGPNASSVGPVIGTAEEAPNPADYGRSIWRSNAISLLGSQNSNGIALSDSEMTSSVSNYPSAMSIASCDSGSTSSFLLCPGDFPYLRVLGQPALPSEPRDLQGTISSEQVALTWQTPADTGSTEILGYRIEYIVSDGSWSNPAGQIDTATPRTVYELTGLTNGTTYDVRVYARNPSGYSSQPAQASFAVADVPSKPAAPNVESVGDAQASLSWTPPTDNGGSPLVDYLIEYSVDNGASWLDGGTTDAALTTATVIGLTNNIGYRFRVSARNSDGSSSPSEASDEVVIGEAPNPPTDLEVSDRTLDSLGIQWTQATGGTGSLTGHRIQYSSDSGASWSTYPQTFAGTATSGMVENLTETQEYQFRVIAINAVGESSPSEPLTAVVGLTPDPPSAVSATVSYESSNIQLAWNAPSYLGSGDSPTFTVEENINSTGWQTRFSGEGSSSSEVWNLAGFTAGDYVTFRVFYSNAAGDGAAIESSTVKYAGATSQPRSLYAAQDSNALDLYWDTPFQLNGSTIDGYKIERSTDDGQTWSVLSSNTGSLATSYSDGTAVDGLRSVYRVAAITTDGLVSDWSSTSSPSIASSCLATPQSGSGTDASPYLISSAGNLEWIRLDPDRWGSSYELTADIDLSSCTAWRLPIGDSTTPFTGTFDGAGFEIAGLSVNSQGASNTGMFGVLGVGASVTNLNLADVTVSGGRLTGALAGSSYGDVTAVSVSGSISGIDKTGGLIGQQFAGTIQRAAAAVTVDASSYVGGLIGLMANSDSTVQQSLSDSYVLANVSSINHGSGLVSTLSSGASVSTSFASGTVSGNESAGLVRYNSGTITDSYWNSSSASPANSDYGTALTAAQMRQSVSFSGFSLDATCSSTSSIWSICAQRNFGFPYLSNLDRPGEVGLPSGVVANADDGSATITWDASTQGTRFPVTSYTVTASPGGATCTASSGDPITRSCEITGLRNAQPYTFSVTATNALATTAPSDASNAVTPTGTSDFVSTWSISSPGQTITLPLLDTFGADYDFTVNWGDGTVEAVTDADLPVTHTYASAGDYTVRIAGTLVGWSFGQVPDSKDAITDISQWGSFTINGTTGAFEGASNLDISAIDAPNLNGELIIDRFFADATSLTTPDLSSWDVSSAISMSSFFLGASSFNGDISTWDTSNVQQMNSFLKGATSFDQDLGSLSIGSLTTAVGFLDEVTLTTSNYEALLVGWAGQDPPDRTVGFSGGNSTWEGGGASGNARAVLVNKGWNISDGGGTPSAPMNLTAQALGQGSLLDWDIPTETGGSFILIDRYEYSVDGGTWITTGSNATEKTIADLDAGTQYSIRIRAVNSIGSGQATDPVTVTPTVATPSAPTDITVTSGDGVLDLEFTVTQTGGADITSVEFSSNGVDGWTSLDTVTNTTGNTYTAQRTGLENGTLYTFYLRVGNGTETSSASSAVSGTPATIPGAPTISAQTSGDEITVSLDAPSSTGGATILRYEYRLNDGSWHEVPSFPLTLTDLEDGSHSVDVRAVNEEGNGPADTVTITVSNPEPLPTAPGQVTGLAAVAADASVTLTWNAASGTVTDYEVNTGSGWEALNSTSTSTTVINLVNGDQYSISVRAVNGGVAGTASASITIVVGIPGQVSNLSATPGENWVTLSWNAPESPAAPISTYEYSIDGGLTWADTESESTQHQIEDLSSEQTYSFAVRAVNAYGPGAASSIVNESPQAPDSGGGSDETSSPSAPQNVDFTASSTSISVSWDAPSSDGGSAIIGYRVLYVIEGQQDFTSVPVDDPDARSHTISDLQAGQTYLVGLVAVNGEGMGESVTDTVTVGDAPGAPTGLAAEPGNETVDLTWIAPASGSSAITDYEYSINSGVDWSSLGTTGTSATVTGLNNGQDYTFTIRAVNSSGAGEASLSVTQRPGVPKAPASVSAQMSNDVVELEWSEPDHHGIGIDGYEITVTQLSGRVLTARSIVLTRLTARASSIITSSTSYTLTGMTGGSYRISVRAINTYGPGLAAVTSIGSIPADDDEWVGPAPHVQQFGAPADPTPERCAATAPTGLNWSGVPSGGWGVSWATWVNSGAGGMICTRTLVYDRWQAKWVLAA